ncbi:unnamed protein product [Protopolystoma xenopodis]|uniref:Uncharacterized protein n=1 Tax=Protopolystoma xenopodis TaxID=117903 RepID=A0A3S5AQI3_9PLAT|nr:unnamed protein product [Protopolystoma xenopodis]
MLLVDETGLLSSDWTSGQDKGALEAGQLGCQNQFLGPAEQWERETGRARSVQTVGQFDRHVISVGPLERVAPTWQWPSRLPVLETARLSGGRSAQLPATTAELLSIRQTAGAHLKYVSIVQIRDWAASRSVLRRMPLRAPRATVTRGQTLHLGLL